MPKFELVLGRQEGNEEPLTLVEITEGEFTGVLIEIEDVRVTANAELEFTYNLYGYTGSKPDTDKLDKAVEEIVYVILDNIEEEDERTD